jgi:LysM repeat protein
VRIGWHVAHISDNLLDLLLLVDGGHTVAEIAEELERRQDRPVHPAEVAYLLRERLAATGLVRLRRGQIATGSARVAAYAAPTVPLAAEMAPTVAAESTAGPLVLAAPATVQAPASTAQPEVPASSVLDEPPDVVMPLGFPAPTPEPTLTPALVPPLPAPEPGDADGMIDLAEIGAALAPTSAPERAQANGHVATLDAGQPALPTEESGAQTVDDALDDEPTLVLPRDLAHLINDPTPDLARPPFDAALASATRDGTGAPRPHEGARPTRHLPTGAVGGPASRGVPRHVVLQLAGIALLALVVALALNGNLSELFGANSTLQPLPTAAPTATSTPPRERILAGETAYDVRSGDTLNGVAARAHISAAALTLVNADVLSASGTLVPGMRLAIPATYQSGVPAAQQPRPLYYTLRSGDTLYQLGQLFGLDWQTIATYNHITDECNLPGGQGIIIPAQP